MDELVPSGWRVLGGVAGQASREQGRGWGGRWLLVGEVDGEELGAGRVM